MDKKNIIVGIIWILLLVLIIFTQTSQMILTLLFTLFILTYSEEKTAIYIKNTKIQKIASSIISITVITLVIIALYYSLIYMAKDLMDIAENSQEKILKNIEFLGITNIEQIYQELITFLKQNVILFSNSAIVLFKIFIGFILGFIFHFSTIEHNQENTLEAHIINDLKKYGKKIFKSFRNIIEVQVLVSIMNTVIISLLAIGFYISGETLPFWYIIIPMAAIVSLIPVVGNIIINLMLILGTLQISLVYVVIGVGSFLVAHKLELIIIGKKIKQKINIPFLLVLLSMLIGELLFHSMSGMLLGMVIVLSLINVAREIKYR